jgi:hypothetical protein
VDSKLNNSLHYAVAGNSISCVSLLLASNEGLISQKNRDGKNPTDLIRSLEMREAIEGRLSLKALKREPSAKQRNGSYDKELRNSQKSTTHELAAKASVKGDPEKQSLDMYVIKAHLGKGSFGEVFLVQNKYTKEFGAMKMLDKSKLTSITLSSRVPDFA